MQVMPEVKFIFDGTSSLFKKRIPLKKIYVTFFILGLMNTRNVRQLIFYS